MAFLRSVLKNGANKKYSGLGPSGRACLTTAADKKDAELASASAQVNQLAPRDPLDIKFEDAKAAFKSKTTWELCRAYLVYTICSFDTIVENNMKVRS